MLALLINFIIPTIILSKLSDANRLGPVYALIVALSFPLLYGIYNLIKSKKVDFISVIGLVGILVSGILGLLQLNRFWFAVKEAAVPSLIGCFVMISASRPNNPIQNFIFNESIFQIDAIKQAMQSKGTNEQLPGVLKNATMQFSGAFFLSAVLNFVLAMVVIQNPPGTAEFNSDLAKMNALSFPIILIPVLGVAIWVFKRLGNRISALSGLDSKSVFKS